MNEKVGSVWHTAQASEGREWGESLATAIKVLCHPIQLCPNHGGNTPCILLKKQNFICSRQICRLFPFLLYIPQILCDEHSGKSHLRFNWENTETQ